MRAIDASDMGPLHMRYADTRMASAANRTNCRPFARREFPVPLVTDYVGLHARRQPDQLAAQDLTSGQQINYGQWDRAIACLVAALHRQGIDVGDRVGVLAKNCIEIVSLHLACARLGAIMVPFSWRLSRGELATVIEDADPALMLGDELLGEFGVDGLDLRNFASEANALLPASSDPFDPARPSLILYTSGTSGRPKGVVLSESNIEQTAINFGLLGGVTMTSHVLCDAPMFHVIGIVTNIRPALMVGGTLYISDGFVAERTLDRMADRDLGITHYFCVPQMAAMLRASPEFDPERLRSLVAIFTGGAPHPAANILAWLDDGIPIVDGFGMTEGGTIFGMPMDMDLIRERAGSAGIPTPGVQARIIRSDGQPCAIGEAGELLVRGRNFTNGYWNRPEDSKASFTEDGWLRTGDIAKVDDAGFYWLVDRRKDMFISGGENVYPAEIEAAIAGHPDLAEFAVVGVPDERWGEVGHLAIVPLPGRSVDAQAIVNELNVLLARYKVPKHVSILPALPRNGAGKILKVKLKEQLAKVALA